MFHCEWGRKPIKNKSFIIIGCQRIFSFLSKQDPFDLLMYHAQWFKKLEKNWKKQMKFLSLLFFLIMKAPCGWQIICLENKNQQVVFWPSLNCTFKKKFRALCVRENLLELLECLWLVINRTLRIVLTVESNLKIPNLELPDHGLSSLSKTKIALLFHCTMVYMRDTYFVLR